MALPFLLAPANAAAQGQGSWGGAAGLFPLFLAIVAIGIGLWMAIVYGVFRAAGGSSSGGKIVATLIAFAPIAFIALLIGSTMLKDVRRALGEWACTNDLEKVPETLAVDSLLDETGGLKGEDIRHLLLSVQLKFVEIRLDARKVIAGGNQAWPSRVDHGIARIALADDGAPNCYVADARYPQHFFTNFPPVRPGTCMTVTYEAQPTASAALSEQSDIFFSRWELRRLKDGAILAQIRDSMRSFTGQKYPPRWSRSAYAHTCQFARNGYGMVLDRVRSTEPGFASGRVLTVQTLPLEMPSSWKGFAETIAAPDLPVVLFTEGKPTEPVPRYEWKEAYAQAEKHGSWMYGRQWIQPRSNTVTQLKFDLAGEIAAIGDHLVFFGINSTSGRPMGVLFYGADGRLRGAARTAPDPSSPPGPTYVPFLAYELTPHALIVHRSPRQQDSWSLRFDRAALEAIRVPAEKSSR